MKKIAFTFIFISILIALQAQTTTETKLKEAKDLYDKQLITQSEYESLKKKALGLDDKPASQAGNTLTVTPTQDVEGFKRYLEKKVNEESKGLIKFIGFTKTDGAKRIVEGQNWYDMYFYLEIQPIREIYKPGNQVPMFYSMAGLWTDFTLSPNKPQQGSLDEFSSLASGGVKIYPANKAIKLTGNSESYITETGWKISKLRFSKEEQLGVDRIQEMQFKQDFISKADNTPSQVKIEQYKIVTANKTFLFKIADTTSFKENFVVKNAILLRTKESVNFYYCTYNDSSGKSISGWVQKTDVRDYSEEPKQKINKPQNTDNMYVVASNKTFIYNSPDIEGKTAQLLTKGTIVTQLKLTRDYYYCSYRDESNNTATKWIPKVDLEPFKP